MRLNRVLAMLGLVVATGIGLITVEGHNLRLKQKVTELSHQREWLSDEQARLRLTVSRLSAPARVLETLHETDMSLEEPRLPVANEPRVSVPPYFLR